MAITNISISQDNKVGDSDLLAVQSPLIFLVDVTYTGLIPDVLYCDLYDKDSVLLSTFKCIPYKDLLPTIRQFMFIADGILRGYMEDFNDFVQAENTLEYVEDITKIFELKFRDPDAGVTDEPITFTAIHAIRQFGENPNLSEIYNNDTDSYIAAKDKSCYVYFYNNNESNVISVDAGNSVKFIITDSSGFINEAKITIGGIEYLTDINGEASIFFENGDYNYEVEKYSYLTKSGSFTINNDIIIIEIELVDDVLYLVTFDVSYNSVPINNAEIIIEGIDDPIYTNPSGIATINLYSKTYNFSVNADGDYYIYNSSFILDYVNLDVNVVMINANIFDITFIVKDGDVHPIKNALITVEGDEYYTDINGVKVLADLPPNTYLCSVEKVGYTSSLFSIEIIDDDVIKRVILNVI